jgi:hypothetical protein
MRESLSGNKIDSLIRKIELTTAILLTLIIIFLDYTFMRHGGALWRDEANSVNLATMPSFPEVWHHLQFDSFPLLISLLLRFWTDIGLNSDLALRFFGFFIGISTLAALWFTVRTLGIRTPLLSMLLFAFNPYSVRCVSSVRPYGIGILFALLTFALTERLMKEFRLRHFIFAVLVATLGVQSVYQNVFFLISFVFAAMVITALKRKWREVFLLLLIPFIAALSLLPYWPIVKKAQDWIILRKAPVSLLQVGKNLFSTLAAAGNLLPFVWMIFFLLAIGLTIYSCFFKADEDESQEKRDSRLFCAIAMIASAILFFGFLRFVSVPTNPWYYLPIMAIVAVCLDVIIGTKKSGAILRIALVLMVAAPTFTYVLYKCRIRQTNIDIAAYMLEKSAPKDDLVVIYPWYLSIGFQRYYGGQAPFITIPPINDHRIHRFDLIKAKMVSPHPLQPLFDEILKTLQAGHKVWIIKETADLSMVPDSPAFFLEPAPNSPFGWSENTYEASWRSQILNFIHALPVQISYFQLLTDDPVIQYENCSVVEISNSR